MIFSSCALPYIVTHDGRTIRYPDPLIRANDTVDLDLEQNKIVDYVKFDMVTGGRTMGRAGVITHREHDHGGFDIVHVRDSLDPYLQHLGHRRGHQALDLAAKLTISEERDVHRRQKAAALEA